MTHQEALNVLYFVNKLNIDESELNQGALLRAVCKRMCDLFIESTRLEDPQMQK